MSKKKLNPNITVNIYEGQFDINSGLFSGSGDAGDAGKWRTGHYSI